MPQVSRRAERREILVSCTSIYSNPNRDELCPLTAGVLFPFFCKATSRNNVTPDIWALIDPGKLTYQMNQHGSYCLCSYYLPFCVYHLTWTMSLWSMSLSSLGELKTHLYKRPEFGYVYPAVTFISYIVLKWNLGIYCPSIKETNRRKCMNKWN